MSDLAAVAVAGRVRPSRPWNSWVVRAAAGAVALWTCGLLGFVGLYVVVILALCVRGCGSAKPTTDAAVSGAKAGDLRREQEGREQEGRSGAATNDGGAVADPPELIEDTCAQQTTREKSPEEKSAGRVRKMMHPLSTEERARVSEALTEPEEKTEEKEREVIAKLGTHTVMRSSIRTLAPEAWLNDEIINYFFAMLAARDAKLCEMNSGQKRSHFFDTFFITSLRQVGHPKNDGKYTYEPVKGRSLKAPGKDIFALDKIFVPINKGMSHWVCAVIYMQEKRIQFYDSLGADGKDYLRHLLRYLKDDHKDKKNVPLPDPKSWKLVSCDRETTPQQPNGCDCGVYTCLFADFLSVDFPLNFDQKVIPQCRDRMALAILRGPT